MDPRGRKVLLLGDSLSSGPNTPGGLIAEGLRARGATVVVSARKSRSAINLFDGTNGEDGAGILTLEAAKHPDLVIVFLGTNDLGRRASADEAAFWRIVGYFPNAARIAIGPPSFARSDLTKALPTVYKTLNNVFGPMNIVEARVYSRDILTTAQGRASDGVHFAIGGARTLADRLLKALDALPEPARPAMPAVTPAAIGPITLTPTAFAPWRWAIGGIAAAGSLVGLAWFVRRRRSVARSRGVRGPLGGRRWMSPDGGREIVDERDTPHGRRVVIKTAGRPFPELLPPGDVEAEIRRDEQRAARIATRAEPTPARDLAEQVRAFSTNPKITATLLHTQGFNGKFVPRHVYIESAVTDGARVETGPKGRRLVKPDGAFFTEKDVSKSAMDYAVWLTARQGGVRGAPATYTAAQASGFGRKLARELTPARADKVDLRDEINKDGRLRPHADAFIRGFWGERLEVEAPGFLDVVDAPPRGG